MFYYILALFVLGLDQVTKWMIVKNMHFGESITVIENVFYITSHRNRGAAFGILQNQMWFFIIITIAVIFAVIYYMQKHAKHQPLLRLAGTGPWRSHRELFGPHHPQGSGGLSGC